MDTLAALYAPGSPEADYWQARHRLATTARKLNEKLVSADITPELADTIREDLRANYCPARSLRAGQRLG